MKWNWGTKLVVWMAAFMTMLVIFAVLMINEEISLVEVDYYPKGQTHQELIEKKQNAKSLTDQITVVNNKGVLEIQFPLDLDPELISGNVHLYHVMDDKLDKYAEIRVNETSMMMLDLVGLSGRYLVKIDWKYLEIDYYTELKLNLP
ncbi:MAG: FixH family protein [Bacteroidetes bacterium]|nr:FixH family protein [Bacteroidota bacterium]